MENKGGFVSDLVDAQVRNGGGRYDWLRDDPVAYLDDRCAGVPNGEEHLSVGGKRKCVTADSLTGIARGVCALVDGD